MGSFIHKIASCFWNPFNPTSNSSKKPKISQTCSKNSITDPALSRIQSIIQTVGRQKSSFAAKLKVTMKPIGTFLWKHFYCRLCNVLKKIGLFSKEPEYLTEIIPEAHAQTYNITQASLTTMHLELQSLPKPQNALFIQQANQSKIPYEETTAFLTAKPTNAIAIFSKEPERFDTAQTIKPLIAYGLSFANQSEIPYEETTAFLTAKPTNAIATLSKEPERFGNAKIVKKPLTAIASQKEMPYRISLSAIPEESALSILLEKQEMTKEEFFHAASELFGKELIERVCSWKKVSLPEILKKNDLLHALAIIGHGVTIQDLAQLLVRINKGEVSLKLSKKTEDFSQLPVQDRKRLMDFFRNPLQHLFPNEEKILWEELEASDHPIDSKRLAYTKYEYFVHKLAQEASTLTDAEKKLLPFAASEQMAKFVGYAKPDTICKDMVIPIFTTKCGIVYYKLEDHINKKGLHCYLFTPLNTDLTLPAQLVFRGTDGIESVERDILDSKGIGKTVFNEVEEEIAKMLNSYCASTANPSLEISGHSLGGIDAQRATVLCVKLFNDDSKPISRLSRISCSAFCSPKLDAATIDLWKTEIQKASSLQLELNFAYHENDIVTWAGYKNLYIPDELAKNTNLQATYMHVSSSTGIATTNHHRMPFFKGAKFDSTFDNRQCFLYASTNYAKLNAELIKLRESQLLELKDFYNNLKESSGYEDTSELISIINYEEIEIEEQRQKKEKIEQNGFSSENSWFVYILEKLLIKPTQTTAYYLVKG